MIITCPNCHTKYQLAAKAISSAGRKVQCAHCRQSWLAHPDPEPVAAKVEKPKLVVSNESQKPASEGDALFGESGERELDEAFEHEAEAAAAEKAESKKRHWWQKKSDRTPQDSPAAEVGSPAPPASPNASDNALEHEEDPEHDPVELHKQQKALQKRQAILAGRLPLARIKRTARLAIFFAIAAVFGAGVLLRTEVVRFFPDLGGLYKVVGLEVNVIGLEFGTVKTLRTPREGHDVMIISAKIRNITGHNVAVPPVLVSILGEEGETLYQWTARPLAQLLGPGEAVDFETQLKSAPVAAASVRLIFAEGLASIAGQEKQSNNGTGI